LASVNTTGVMEQVYALFLSLWGEIGIVPGLWVTGTAAVPNHILGETKCPASSFCLILA
jgi:hypothetical protein